MKAFKELSRQLQLPRKKLPDPPHHFTPGSLEYRVASSPYAALLASPLRNCAYSSRMLPKNLLLRFGLGRHPDRTNHRYAYPTVGHRGAGFLNKGHYARLSKKVCQKLLYEYGRLFRGNCDGFRSDMPDVVQDKLAEYALDQMQPLLPDARFITHDIQPDGPYQCIFSTSEAPALSAVVPVYNPIDVWGDEACKQMKLTERPMALLKKPETARAAMALWRWATYVKNAQNGSINTKIK